ncbi:MAG: (2Fe-2S)-binding protein [Betaproteobacteria bacterium]|nr:(2Fe-2S)-binding protein [Betaproteobacteria bacterium]
MDRRGFISICAAGAAVGINPAQAANLRPRFYARVRLVDEARQPLRAANLAANRNYIFHYPYAATPCFLLNLGKPTQQAVTLKTETGGDYEWPGGVGPQNAIVGYSAICAHQLSYPTRQISFISYRSQPGPSRLTHGNVIHCCSEHSEYDPATGARVLGGPAPQPLSAILLEHDRVNDHLYAVGTLGGEMFEAFFAKYEFKLAIEYGDKRARQPVTGAAVVAELQKYCRQQVQC